MKCQHCGGTHPQVEDTGSPVWFGGPSSTCDSCHKMGGGVKPCKVCYGQFCLEHHGGHKCKRLKF